MIALILFFRLSTSISYTNHSHDHENGFGDCQIAGGAISAIVAAVFYLMALVGILVTTKQQIRAQIQKRQKVMGKGRLNKNVTTTSTSRSRRVKIKEGDGRLQALEVVSEAADITVDATCCDDDHDSIGLEDPQHSSTANDLEEPHTAAAHDYFLPAIGEINDGAYHPSDSSQDPFPCHLSDIEDENSESRWPPSGSPENFQRTSHDESGNYHPPGEAL
jgi:hypothetical protein